MAARSLLSLVLLLHAARAGAQSLLEGRPHPDVEKAVVQVIHDSVGSVSGEALRNRPIGIFDSGTGGLTVLEQILSLDAFDNATGKAAADGQPDFAGESFVFLADQANMPYGNYPVVGKDRVLDDLLLKDAQFLLGKTYYASPADATIRRDKQPAKVLVIACNTATAYGKPDIERVTHEAGIDVKVIGVVDAGAEGALAIFADGRPGSIGVLPTKGTALSGCLPPGYRSPCQGPRADGNRSLCTNKGLTGPPAAIDGAPELIARGASIHDIRKEYRGPSLKSSEARIDASLLGRYDFDFSGNRMLYSGSPAQPTQLQLNSVENYIKYHLVTLLEQIRTSQAPQRYAPSSWVALIFRISLTPSGVS